MKNLLTLITVLVVVGFASAQTKFEKAILKGKEMLSEADSAKAYQPVINYFERIASKETGEWLPLYYQAQILAITATSNPNVDEKEVTLNSALELITQAKKIDKNAELLALEGFVQMIRLTVDPATRGQTLSPTIFGLYNEALKLDAKNPRALLFLGQMQYGTAQFFGSGFEEACKNVKMAYDIFEEQPGEPTILPTWGKGSAQAALDNCNQ
ncbi:MAG: hypothetical protein RIC35_13270 [Marinoscillum sp.]